MIMEYVGVKRRTQMSRGLTQEQKDYLDKVMKEYRQRTGTALGSVR